MDANKPDPEAGLLNVERTLCSECGVKTRGVAMSLRSLGIKRDGIACYDCAMEIAKRIAGVSKLP